MRDLFKSQRNVYSNKSQKLQDDSFDVVSVCVLLVKTES